MNGSRSSRPTTRDLLSRIDIKELKLLRVAVKRSNITAVGPALPLEREIDDPAKIVPLVHFRKDESKLRKPPIFGKDIKVNQEFDLEERLVLADANKLDQQRETSRSCSRSKSRSRSHRRSRSRDNRRSRTPRRSKSHSVTRNRRQSPNDRHRRSRSRSPVKKASDYRRSYSKDRYRKSKSSIGDNRARNKYKSKSPTPLRPGEYRPNHPDLALRYDRRSKSPRDKEYCEKSRYRRSRSLSKDRHKPSTSRKSPSPHKQQRGHSRSPARHDLRRQSVSPSRGREKRSSPSRYVSPRGTRRSRSPSKPDKLYKSSGHKSLKGRSKSPSRYERHDRRSRSPIARRGPEKRISPNRSSDRHRYSRSPGRYDKRRSSKSPTNYRSREPRRSSRSPHSRPYYKNRRRSKSPSRRRSRSPRMEHVPPDYAFYENEYWIPGVPGQIRPGFQPFPRFYPPAMYPRGMMPPGPPFMVPPRMMHPAAYHPYHPRQNYPVYNRPRTKLAAQMVTSSATSENIVASTSGTVQITEENGEPTAGNSRELTDTANGKSKSNEEQQKIQDESSKENKNLHDD